MQTVTVLRCPEALYRDKVDQHQVQCGSARRAPLVFGVRICLIVFTYIRNKKLVVTSATLVVTGALLVVTKSY